MKSQGMIAVKMLLAFTILTGILYPLMITGLAQLIFPHQANGSLVKKDGRLLGSELIGQKTDSSIYFWPRPSATDYNTLPSGGSNLGPTSEKLKNLAEKRRKAFVFGNNLRTNTVVPAEMVFASASGLDPHISPRAALLQMDRIAAARSFSKQQKRQLEELILKKTELPQFSLLGEARVNVFMLNLALDKTP
ncbi:MAG: potassium-transporting ATPase subunit KdpC [Lentimicrobiaceae bacterium]|jgi:K+-transporting ATPase ATPase C chain|nr:potassium-transporting ATPase subunit KdpC [Lentimicrobiaceae bacterium]